MPGHSDREISPLCDLRATAFTATARFGANIKFLLRRTFRDNGIGGERRQIVLAQALRMVGAARQRNGLRFHNNIFNSRPLAPISLRGVEIDAGVVFRCASTSRSHIAS
jgi:hypothetical protein